MVRPIEIFIHIHGDAICILNHLIETHLLIFRIAGIENWKSCQDRDLLSFNSISSNSIWLGIYTKQTMFDLGFVPNLPYSI